MDGVFLRIKEKTNTPKLTNIQMTDLPLKNISDALSIFLSLETVRYCILDFPFNNSQINKKKEIKNKTCQFDKTASSDSSKKSDGQMSFGDSLRKLNFYLKI